jgi:NAD+ synthase (glutamine-hydrolysing)
VRLIETPIEKIYQAYLDTLLPRSQGLSRHHRRTSRLASGQHPDGLSNKFGWLVLTTGNKSEMSVGYATLYGDMAGGFM